MARNARWQFAWTTLFLLVGFGHAASLAKTGTATTKTGTTVTTTGSGTASSPATANSSDTTASSDNASPSSIFATTGSTTSVSHLTGLPTIGGVGIPTLVIPYTANAPFMQKSSLPQGTFFIAVGATLAFMGACVLSWRVIVAWSIKLSVKKSAKASMAAHSEKSGGWNGRRGSSGYNAVSKPAFYGGGDSNSVSMEHLTTAGKPVKHHYRDSMAERSKPPPQDLFFSPTAQPRDGGMSQHRTSGYMPSGFYASPSSQPAANTTIGHHGRTDTYGTSMSRSSPPVSPVPPSRGSATSRGALRDDLYHGREGSRAAPAREVRNQESRNSRSYTGRDNSINTGGGQTSRAPSAYLEEMIDNHGRGQRDRYR